MCKKTAQAIAGTPGTSQENSNTNIGLLNMSRRTNDCAICNDLHYSCDMSVYGLQMGKEMLRKTSSKETGADQEPEPTDTNGESKPGGPNAHATDLSTYSSASTCPASTNHHPPKPVQNRFGRHRRAQL